jgi:hypothetical protein
MNIKLKRILIVIGFFVVGLFFASISDFGLCDFHSYWCGDFFEEMIGVTIGFFAVASIVPIIILSFMNSQVYESWWKFTKKYLIIAAILIVLAPISGGGGLFIGMGGGYDREGMIWFTSGLFFIISMILIPLKFRKYRPIKEKQFLGISQVHKDSSRD